MFLAAVALAHFNHVKNQWFTRKIGIVPLVYNAAANLQKDFCGFEGLYSCLLAPFNPNKNTSAAAAAQVFPSLVH
jgi:hypothetical protein